MNRRHGRAFIAAALLVGAGVAQAGNVTLTGWTFGSGNIVNVTAPAHYGWAGGFSGSLSGFGPLFDSPSFATYCVELTESFYFSSAPMSGYILVSGSLNAGWGANAAAISNRLGKLMTYVKSNSTAVDTAGESTSLQLAIWNTIYDTDSSLVDGSFKDLSGYGAYAGTLLAASASTVSNLTVSVLTKAGSQDFLVTSPIPEPSTYALLLAGLAGIGVVARQRLPRG